MSALSQHVIEEIRELPARFPQPRSAVMPALDLAQEEIGYLTPEAMTEVAAALNLDAGYVEGVATFYSLFHLQPTGKHHFYFCTNLSCMLRGSDGAVRRFQELTGLKEPREVSSDRMFSYDEVECLGACEYAPMLRLDHRYHYDLTPARIDSIVNDCRLPRPYQKRIVEAAKPAAKPARPRAPRKKKGAESPAKSEPTA